MTLRLRTSGLHRVSCTAAVAAAVCIAAAVQAQVNPHLLQGLQWRNIGPFIAGKVDSVSGVNGQPAIAYVGTDNGGVWKTVNAGVTWFPVTDAVHAIRGITALAVAQSQPRLSMRAPGACLVPSTAAVSGNPPMPGRTGRAPDWMMPAPSAGCWWIRTIPTWCWPPRAAMIIVKAERAACFAALTADGRGNRCWPPGQSPARLISPGQAMIRA